MVKIGKNLLENIVEMASCKNMELKNCPGIEGGNIGGNCKDSFGNK